MTDELAFTGVADQAALVRSGAVSSRELVESARVRMFAAEPELHACTSILDDALTAADDADRRRVHGEELPLLGVPVVVKDSADVAGTVTSFGTAASARPAAADCEAVARLRAAGAVIVAKTTLPELAAFTHFTSSKRFGTTRNPWDPTRSSGGSSGGSAVAVAAGYVGAALASDGGGSIRVPAACCGIVGLKPQRGRIPLSPARDHWNGLGVLGPMAREVNDVALMMDVLTSPVGEHSTQFRDAAERGPSRLKIALSSRPSHSTAVSEEITGAVVDTGHLLERLGHVVEERDPDYGDVRAATVPRYLRGVVDDCAALDDPARLEARTRSLVRFGRLVSRRRLARALAFEPELVRRVNSLFDDFDVLMTPVIAQPAPPVDIWASRGAVRNLVGGIPWIAFTQVWNVTGQPALSVPAGLDRDGMPIAVQLVGRRESEAGLLRLAAAIERARPWSYPPSRTR